MKISEVFFKIFVFMCSIELQPVATDALPSMRQGWFILYCLFVCCTYVLFVRMSCLTSPSGTDGIPSLLLKISQISKVNQDPDDLNGLLIASRLPFALIVSTSNQVFVKRLVIYILQKKSRQSVTYNISNYESVKIHSCLSINTPLSVRQSMHFSSVCLAVCLYP